MESPEVLATLAAALPSDALILDRDVIRSLSHMRPNGHRSVNPSR